MVGQTLGHYKILDKLGAGGMGEVYRAEDTTLDREVALKILPPDLADSQERLDRFQREAKTLAALDHPNIVHIHTVEEVDGVHFLTMQLVEGKPLSQLIPKGGMPLERIFEIAIPLADALATAHEKGVVHRDLKPANVMVNDQGRVKVLDFGLAKLRQEAQTPVATQLPTEPLTQEGLILGTMPYMSPEQLEAKDLDVRSDIFSLGVMLYEMVTGERPFHGDTSASLIMSIGRDVPPEVDTVREELPHHLGRVVSRCLEKNPEDRYQSVKEVRNEFRFLKKETDARPISKPEVGVQKNVPTRRSRWPMLVAAGLAVVALALWLVLGGRQPEAEVAEESQAVAAGSSTEAAPPPMIVVLPFENLGTPEDEYFADGMTEEITSRLAVVSGLRVISRTSAMQYKVNRPSLKQVGEELGVDYVLEGSVRWARADDGLGRVRITPQLIRTSDDSHLWADSYDRVVEDIFEIQSEIASQVVDQLGISLGEREVASIQGQPTENLDAYQAYLRGLYLDRQPDFGLAHREAIVESFQKAVNLDPEFALAYAQLAKAHSFMIHLGFDASDERRRASWEAAEKALALAPESPHVLLGVGFYHYQADKDYEAALENFQRAARVLPNDAAPIASIAYVQRRLGLWADGVENLKRAFDLSPRQAMLPAMLCEYLRDMRQYERALHYCDESIALSPDSSYSFFRKAATHLLWRGDTHRAREVLEASPTQSLHSYHAVTDLLFLERNYEKLVDVVEPGAETWYWNQTRAYPMQLIRAQALGLAGEDDLALEAFEQALVILRNEISKTPGDHRLHSSLGLAQAGLGRKVEAIEQGLRGVELMPFSKDAYLGDNRVRDLAQIYSMVGELESAVEQLEELLSVPSDISAPWLRLDPRWDPLRDHPRFQALLEKYGQEAG